MRSTPLIWLTRPHTDSETLVEDLSAQGIASIISPLMAIKPQPVTITEKSAPAALLLTSRHAASALATLAEPWRGIPVYCVGGATAESATKHGFYNIISGETDIESMLPRLAADMPAHSRILYFSGAQKRVDVASLLGEHSIRVDTTIAYQAVAATALTDEICAALTAGRVNAITLFSPRSAAIACSLLSAHGLEQSARGIDALCLSQTVVQAAAIMPWASIHSCDRPTRSAMIDLIVSPRKEKV